MINPSPAIQQIATRLQGLTQDEKRVLGLRFALDGTRNHTLDEVATVLNTGPAEVRRIEQLALGKLSDSVA
jgi:DNA-directed RNA polymerase sigma subunit (sigma70/sigma32)